MEELGRMEGLTVRLITSKKQLPCFVRLDQHSMHCERPWIAYNGVLEKVKYSNWASTVYQPEISTLTSTLAGGRKFS